MNYDQPTDYQVGIIRDSIRGKTVEWLVYVDTVSEKNWKDQVVVITKLGRIDTRTDFFKGVHNEIGNSINDFLKGLGSDRRVETEIKNQNVGMVISLNLVHQQEYKLVNSLKSGDKVLIKGIIDGLDSQKRVVFENAIISPSITGAYENFNDLEKKAVNKSYAEKGNLNTPGNSRNAFDVFVAKWLAKEGITNHQLAIYVTSFVGIVVLVILFLSSRKK